MTVTAPEPTTSPTGAPGSACTNGGSYFTLSLASSTGGQPTPQAAAQFFARHGDPAAFPVPLTGWVVVGHDAQAATVRSANVSLHVAEGPDHTWQVDSGSSCA